MRKMSSVAVCVVCGLSEDLLRCSHCKNVYYCTKAHQKQDWKRHKVACKKFGNPENQNTKSNQTQKQNKSSVLPVEGSSENEILSSKTESLSLNLDFREKSSTAKAIKCAKSAMPISGENIVIPRKSSVKDFPEISLKQNPPPFLYRNQDDVLEEVCRNVIRDMNNYGVCVVDNFLGTEKGSLVLHEVLDMSTKGVFKDGQLVSSTGREGDHKTIRGDQITWIDGREPHCNNIGFLISQVDALIIRANKMSNNGKLGDYNINGRTKVQNNIDFIQFICY